MGTGTFSNRKSASECYEHIIKYIINTNIIDVGYEDKELLKREVMSYLSVQNFSEI